MSIERRLVMLLAVAALGRTLHDIMEFGRPSSDWLMTAVAPALLLALVGGSGHMRGPAVALVWGLLNLVGAVVTVLPVSWLPFQPDQTVPHYVSHAMYAGTQLPLIHWSTGEVIRRSRSLTGTRHG